MSVLLICYVHILGYRLQQRDVPDIIPSSVGRKRRNKYNTSSS